MSVQLCCRVFGLWKAEVWKLHPELFLDGILKIYSTEMIDLFACSEVLCFAQLNSAAGRF